MLTDIHRVVKEVLEKLVFSCPKCKDVKRNYSEINKHLQSCDGQGQGVKDEVAIESFKRQASQVTSPQALNYTEIRIHIMEKDSKKFYIYNTRTQSVTLHTVNTGTNFPHNFQAIQVGLINTKVYIIGGGDFNQVPDSMFQCNQLVPSQGDQYVMEAKERMKFPRHGHSCCSFGENLIIVTGSRKDIDRAPFRTEVYNTDTNKWMELG